MRQYYGNRKNGLIFQAFWAILCVVVIAMPLINLFSTCCNASQVIPELHTNCYCEDNESSSSCSSCVISETKSEEDYLSPQQITLDSRSLASAFESDVYIFGYQQYVSHINRVSSSPPQARLLRLQTDILRI